MTNDHGSGNGGGNWGGYTYFIIFVVVVVVFERSFRREEIAIVFIPGVIDEVDVRLRK